MTICKTILTFILLLTGYPVKNMRVAAVESESESTPSVFNVTPTSEEPTTGSDSYDSTGYPVKNTRVAAVVSESESTPSVVSESESTTSDFHVTPTSEEPTTGSDSYDSTAAESNASLLVAGLSIFFVLFVICVIIGVWNARKLSKQDSFDITSAPSGEA